MGGTPALDRDNYVSCRWDAEEKRYITLAEDWKRGKKMLKLSITDDTCDEGDCYMLTVPLETPWNDIQTMIRLVHPTCSEVTIAIEEE